MIADRQTYVKNLVEGSAVPILTERINSLQTTVHNLQSLMFKLERDFQSYTRVTEKLAEEMARHAHISRNFLSVPSKNGKKRYNRYPEAVNERWLEWKRQYESGMYLSEIARIWKVDISSVSYAKRKGFQSAHRQPLTKKEQTNDTNHSDSTDGRTSRPVRGGNQPTKQRRQGTQRRLSPLQA